MMVPGASANSVGLTAATTRPVAATSRTKGPRSTTAVRSRSRGITLSDDNQACALQISEHQHRERDARDESVTLDERSCGAARRGDRPVLGLGAANRNVAQQHGHAMDKARRRANVTARMPNCLNFAVRCRDVEAGCGCTGVRDRTADSERGRPPAVDDQKRRTPAGPPRITRSAGRAANKPTVTTPTI